jgi:dihydroorotate dehydrogenase (fumarate)
VRTPFYQAVDGRGAVARVIDLLGGKLLELPRDYPILLGLLHNQGQKKEDLPSGALHVAVDDASDLIPLTTQDLILIGSSTLQEASDMAALAAVLARGVRAPVVHFFDRRWVGGEFAKIDGWDEERLRKFSAETDTFDGLCARLKEITGRSYAAFESSIEPQAETAAVTLASEAARPGAVRIRLWRPFEARRFLETLPSTVKSLSVAKALNADVLSAIHQGIVGGWSWFVNLPPIKPLDASGPGEGNSEDCFQAVIRTTDAQAEIESAFHEMIADLADHTACYFQAYTLSKEGGAEIHLRIAPDPIERRGPIVRPDVELAVDGAILSWSGARIPSGSLDIGVIARRAGLADRIGPAVVSCLLYLMDCGKTLGLPEGQVRDLLNEAVEERWSDFSEDIVAAHRRAMETTRRELVHPEIPSSRHREIPARTAGPTGKRAAARPKTETDYLGFRLRSPFVACVPDHAGEDLRRGLADAPLGALFFGPILEEELDREAWKTFSALRGGARPLGSQARPPLERHLEALKAWKSSVEVPVIVGMSATSEKNWLAIAFAIEQAGADALELVLRAPEEGGPFDPMRVVSLVSGALRIPVAVRLTPSLAHLAEKGRELAEAGAKAIVLFQRPVGEFLHPDDLKPREEFLLDGITVFRLALPVLARASSAWSLDLAAAGPASASGDCFSALLAGARVAYVVPEPDQLRRLEETLIAWMETKGFDAVEGIATALDHGQTRRRAVE